MQTDGVPAREWTEPNYGYRLPPETGVGWLVRSERLSVGHRLDIDVPKRDGNEVIMPGIPTIWAVVAIEDTGDGGQEVGRQRIGAPTAVWDGTVVLRLVDGYP
jgi:hypothetical protein